MNKLLKYLLAIVIVTVASAFASPANNTGEKIDLITNTEVQKTSKSTYGIIGIELLTGKTKAQLLMTNPADCGFDCRTECSMPVSNTVTCCRICWKFASMFDQWPYEANCGCWTQQIYS